MQVLAVTLLIGFIIWYFYYGVECYLNGGSIGRNQYLMPFQCFWEEFLWFLPGGYNRKRLFFIQRYGKFDPENDLQMLPGRLHFLATHVILPLLPILIVILWRTIHVTLHGSGSW